MNRRWLVAVAAVAAMGLVTAACGDDGGGDQAADETTTTEGSTTTTEAAAAEPGSFSCSTVNPECDGTITPAEGLTDGAQVTIEASGFSPNLGLGVTQCVDADDPDNEVTGDTGAGDCNLRGIASTEADADGNVSVEFTVVGGETMVANTQNGRTCDAEHDCVVSVGELAAGETERITFKVKFG